MTPLDAIRRALDASHGSAKAFQAELASTGHVVLSARVAVESLDALRQAEAVMVRELEVIVQSHSTDYDWREGSPLPNVDADAMEHVQPIVDAIAATRRAMGHG